MGTTVGLIVAAGRGQRMGTAVRKPYLELGDRTVLAYTLGAFERCRLIDSYYVVIRPGDDVLFQQRVAPNGPFLKLRGLIDGGVTRRDSVYNGLKQIDPQNTDFVVVHDGVRPFVTPDLIERVLTVARRHGAASLALPLTDTVKQVDEGFVSGTVSRNKLQAVQTPQAYSYSVLMRAHRKGHQQDLRVTDDAELVERLGHRVAIVDGDAKNIKLTTPEDLQEARGRLAGRKATRPTARQAQQPVQPAATGRKAPPLPMRVGTGYDVHPFRAGRPLVLAGVRVAHEQGLDGHSDADVVAHAVCDALLGAAGMGDIGRHFPSSDERYRGADSMWFLTEVIRRMAIEGWAPLQADVTVIAQVPRLEPYVAEMERLLAEGMDLHVDRVNVKATTTDGLGFVGRAEGIAAQAVALIGPVKDEPDAPSPG